MRADYDLVHEAPPLADYLRLRADSGLTPVTAEQGGPALVNSWAWVHVRHALSGEVVAMGRVIGDGGWCFHIADIATLPAHQRNGIGRAVLEALLDRIAQAAPPNPYVTLMADGPGRRLYEQLGFVETAPHSLGMMLAR